MVRADLGPVEKVAVCISIKGPPVRMNQITQTLNFFKTRKEIYCNKLRMKKK